MDGRTLMEIMQSPNFSMWGLAENAFKLDQQKKQADLATTLGLEQRNQAMLPAELAGKQAVARLNNSTAAMNEDTMAANISAAQRQKQKLQESLSKMDDVTRQQFKAKVIHSLQLASAMKKNGGQLPPGFSLSPEEVPYYTPDKLEGIIAHGQAFLEMDPEEIAKRQRAAEAERLARIRGQVQMDVKGTPTPGKDTTPTLDNAGILAQLNKLKEARQKLAALKVILPQLTEEQQAQWQGAYMSLKKQAEEELRARTAGDVDIPATTKGKVSVTPGVNLGDAPGAVTNRPERQTSGQRITIYKDGKPVGTIPIEQKAQALQQGYTIK